MKVKEYYREMFHKWFGECSPEPEQGDYEDEVVQANSDAVEPSKKESEV